MSLTNPYKAHADAISRTQCGLGDNCPVFTWAGQQWRIIPGSVAMNQPLREGGFSQMYDLTFTALVAPMLTLTIPSISTLKDALLNTPMTYLGDSYKIQSVIVSPGALQMTIAANSLNQNA